MAYLERAVRIRQQANFVPVHRIHHLLIRIMRHWEIVLVSIGGSNEKLNSCSNWFDFVFSILSYFFEDTLYKSTMKSAIIRFVKSVCLHGKQTTGAVWEKINSTRLTSEMKLDFAIRGRSVVICLLLFMIIPAGKCQSSGETNIDLLDGIFVL